MSKQADFFDPCEFFKSCKKFLKLFDPIVLQAVLKVNAHVQIKRDLATAVRKVGFWCKKLVSKRPLYRTLMEETNNVEREKAEKKC